MKNKLYTLLFSFIFTILFAPLQAQFFRISQDVVIRNQDGTPFEMALVGGLNQPHFSSFDLDNDGMLDLVCLDRSGNKVLTFMNRSSNGEVRYVYDHSYEDFFPQSAEVMLFADYDRDGKLDAWVYDDFKRRWTIYRNTTFGLPRFELDYDKIGLRIFNPFPDFDTAALGMIKGSFPYIGDVDGDGDIDLVTVLNFNASNMAFYQNQQVEQGKPNNFVFMNAVDRCFMNVDEWGDEITINSRCDWTRYYNYKKHEANKTLWMIDLDGDGDLDLLFGNTEKPGFPVSIVYNGKSDYGMDIDTGIAVDNFYFSPIVREVTPGAPSFSYVDVDGDGVKDLIMAENETVFRDWDIRLKDNVILLLNKGRDDFPNFEYQQNDFLVGDMLDFGGKTIPAFWDYDDDGDMDLIVATMGDDMTNPDNIWTLKLLKNIGSAQDPDFQIVNEDFLGLESMKIDKPMYPHFADVDGDGLDDLLLGRTDGSISFFKNITTGDILQFDAPIHNFQDINVTEKASPYLYDINGDGLKDLLVGSYLGSIYYYENQGTETEPDFVHITDTFGGIFVNELYKGLTDDFRDTIMSKFFGDAVIGGIGKLCNGQTGIFVGSDQGLVRCYYLGDNPLEDFEEVQGYMNQELITDAYIKDWGAEVAPAVADLNGNGLVDVIIGQTRGGLNYLEAIFNEDCKANIDRIVQEKFPFAIYPNPNDGSFTFDWDHSRFEANYEVYDLFGRLLKSGVAQKGVRVKNDMNLSSGVYLVHLKQERIDYKPVRMVVY
jgi:hypothetical protein